MSGRALVFGFAAAVALVGCGGGSPDLVLSSSAYTFDGRVERPQLRVEATNANGTPGTGTVTFTTAVGEFVEGTTATLVDGAASVTFRCDPSADATCSGAVRIGASWNGVNRSVVVTVGPITWSDTIRWKVQPTNTLTPLRRAVVASDGAVWAVGGETALRYSGGAWTAETLPAPGELFGAWAGAHGELVLVGAKTSVTQWHAGSGFTRTAFDEADDFTCAWGTDATHLWFGTSGGRIVAWDGTTFTVEKDGLAPVRALTGHQLGDGSAELWAAGDGQLTHRTGGVWATESTPVLANWTTARWDPEGLWIAGGRLDTSPQGQGIVLQGGTGAWKSSALGPERANDLFWADGTTERFAVTDSTVWRKMGSAPWEDLKTPTGGSSLAGKYATSVVIVGPPGISLARVE